jgi:hypothetical protein
MVQKQIKEKFLLEIPKKKPLFEASSKPTKFVGVHSSFKPWYECRCWFTQGLNFILSLSGGHLSGVHAFNVICNVTLSSPYLSASFHPPNLSFSGIRKVKKFKQCLLEKLA